MAEPKPLDLENLEEVFGALEIEWYYSTKEELSADEVFRGLLDHGLFAEKIPPCFTSAGLAHFVSGQMDGLLNEADDDNLKKALAGR